MLENMSKNLGIKIIIKKKGKITMNKKSDLGKIAVGAAIGAGAGLLLAPREGKETRKILKNKMDELVRKVKNIDSDKVKKNFDQKIKKLEKELNDLDKEKALAIAKKRSASIKKKADELVDLAKEKDDKVVEKAAVDVQKKVTEVTESVLKKLEEK